MNVVVPEAEHGGSERNQRSDEGERSARDEENTKDVVQIQRLNAYIGVL